MTKQLAYKAQGYLVKNLPAPFRSKGVIPVGSLVFVKGQFLGEVTI